MPLTRITGDIQDTYNHPIFCDDISDFFDGATKSFTLKVDGVAINNLADSRNVQIFMNGLLLKPYIASNNKTLPWVVEISQKNGEYEIVGNSVVFYIPPEYGDIARIAVINTNTFVQKVSNSFSPLTLAFGD